MSSLTDRANSISSFFSNGFSTGISPMNYLIYNGVGGIPFAAYGMVAIVGAVLGYATFSEGSHEIAKSIESGVSIATEKIGDTAEYIQESTANAVEAISDKTEDFAQSISDLTKSTSEGAKPVATTEKEVSAEPSDQPSEKSLESTEESATTKIGGKRTKPANQTKQIKEKRTSRKKKGGKIYQQKRRRTSRKTSSKEN